MKKAKILVISPKCSDISAQYLADLLGCNYSNADRGDYREYDVVINYGSSRQALFNRVINTPQAVNICVNKISTLKRVTRGVEWTKHQNKALGWLQEDGAVVARSIQEGSRGSGITICESEEVFRNSPASFWTRYFWHDHEVRINVYKNKILSVYEKIREDGFFEFKLLKIQGDCPQVQEMIDSISQNIGITIYGMDVLINSAGECKLLEVNSGAAIHEGTEKALIREIKREIAEYA